MKVPIMYKSSERYKAGTDIVYDDGSKLQYPPFIYAVTESDDSGGDNGDEEGEDIMVIQRTMAGLDKNFNDIHSAMAAGKSCIILTIDEGGDVIFHEYVTACYDYGEDYLEAGADHRYQVESTTTVNGEVRVNSYYADTTTDNLAVVGDEPIE